MNPYRGDYFFTNFFPTKPPLPIGFLPSEPAPDAPASWFLLGPAIGDPVTAMFGEPPFALRPCRHK